MPILSVRSVVPPHPGTARGPRVFVSYAHEDARLARTFIKYFMLLWSELGYDERAVFYDAQRLHAGYAWEDVLRESLDSADLLIFLVSADSLRAGHYCMEVEVATAAQAAVPVVPVVLSHCPWQGQRIPGDPRNRTFGALIALPLGRKQDVRPVNHKHWPTRDEAWTAVVDGLRRLLQSMAPRMALNAVSRSDPGPTVVPPDLLPYLCDQSTAVRAFDRGLEAWDSRALMVLLKGRFDDNTAKFWDRLRVEQLPQFLALDRVRGSDLRPHRPFALPLITRGSSAEIRRAILYELSEALAQNRYRIKDVGDLIDVLRGLRGTVPLFALPDAGPPAALRLALEALLGLIDDVADEEAVRRLIVAVNLEQPELLDRNLSSEWNLRSFVRTVLIELEPLSAVDQADARVWYVQRRISELYGVSEQSVTAVFSRDTSLRMRTFESRVQPLLAMPRQLPR